MRTPKKANREARREEKERRKARTERVKRAKANRVKQRLREMREKRKSRLELESSDGNHSYCWESIKSEKILNPDIALDITRIIESEEGQEAREYVLIVADEGSDEE